MKKKTIIALIIAMLTCCLTGCVNQRATVTITIYPVKYLIEQLAGDRVDVEYISTDEFIQRAEMVPKYKDILERTTLFIYVGELEPYMDVFESKIMSYKFEILNLANLSAVNKFKRYTTVTVNNTTVTTESDYYNSDLFDMVDMYDKDPFIWLDPIAMASMASTIKDWLQSYYPEDSLIFENNFKTIQANMVRMDAEYQSLKNLNVKLVTVGCTFGNWQKPYNVQVFPLIMSKYGVLPSDEQLAFIKKTIVENDVKFIVKDETLPEDMMALYEQVRDELKLKEISLSSLSKLSDEDKDKNKDYMTIMYDNLISLEEAFK
ncbi:MAG: zinc ABC transporter substrate-binding protein [Erysipelotrichaceae bacterium]|nr:zinc ABC transporter substrate-binding protein [Erysipelotrichaceae bacterium]